MKTPKQAKRIKSPDLSEYAEEAIPFDAVIRQLAKVKPDHAVLKPRKKAKKRQKSLRPITGLSQTINCGVTHQFPTYGGLLAGMPQAGNWSVEQAIRQAKDYLGQHEEAPAILRPRLTRLLLSTFPDSPQARLPMVASFESKPSVDEQAYKLAVLIRNIEYHEL